MQPPKNANDASRSVVPRRRWVELHFSNQEMSMKKLSTRIAVVLLVLLGFALVARRMRRSGAQADLGSLL